MSEKENRDTICEKYYNAYLETFAEYNEKVENKTDMDITLINHRKTLVHRSYMNCIFYNAIEKNDEYKFIDTIIGMMVEKRYLEDKILRYGKK